MTQVDESTAVIRRRRFSKRRARAGRMFVAPNLTAVAVFMLFPLGFSLYMSVQNWDLFRPAKFVGLANYRSLFADDPLFEIALRNTVVYTVGTVVPTVFISLAVAGVLNRKYVEGTLSLQRGQTGTMDVDYKVARAAQVVSSDVMVYRLSVDPQDLVVPETLHVTVTWPPGFRPSDPLPSSRRASR